jgi:hypothetical protein
VPKVVEALIEIVLLVTQVNVGEVEEFAFHAGFTTLRAK